MASYARPAAAHDGHSFDVLPLGYDAYEGSRHTASVTMDTVSADTSLDKVNIFIVFVFILELLVLVFVSVLEYFLRVTDVFPVREANFLCNDATLGYTKSQGEQSYGDFAYFADVPYEVVVPICFCLPPVLIVICELALWAFTEEHQKTVHALCKPCRVPQVIRRMVRFIGTFLFGLLITMIFVDVTKLFAGQPRPTFLQVCNPNATMCASGELVNDNVCLQSNSKMIRDARLSFPSFHAAVTAFAACFLAIYMHHVIRASSVRVLRPFLSLGFILCSVMCCLARYGLYYSHWADLAIGFVLGLVFAVYISVFVLNNFRERVTSRRLYSQLRDFMFEQRALELRELYKEPSVAFSAGTPLPVFRGDTPWYSYETLHKERLAYPTYPGGDGFYAGRVLIPRPHVQANGHANESSTDVINLSHEDLVQYYPHHQQPQQQQQQPQPLYGAQAPHHQNQKHRNGKSKNQTPNTFQRDLARTLDQYRSESAGGGGGAGPGAGPGPGRANYPGHM